MPRKTRGNDNNIVTPKRETQARHYESLPTIRVRAPHGEEENVENSKRSGPLGGFLRTVVETPKNVFQVMTSPLSSKKRRQSKLNDERTPLSMTYSAQLEQHEVDAEAPSIPSSQTNIEAKAKWKGLAKRVDNGEFLIHRRESRVSTKSTEEKRKEAELEIRSGLEFSLSQCLVAMLLYFAIAIIAFSFIFDHWSIVDSCYFAVVTFTTIGYGDLVPDTKPGRIFTCFFALSGVACLGIVLGVIGSNVMEAEQLALDNAKNMSQQQVLYLFGDGRNEQSERSRQVSSCSSSSGREERQDTDGSTGHFCRGALTHLRDLVFVVLVLLIFASFVANDPGIDVGYDFGSTLYFAIITACTVGYGDFAPQTQQGRLLAVLFIPLAVGAMGHWLSEVASWIIHRRHEAFKKQLDNHELSLDDLEIMDEDGDGEVTRAEFLEFMLLAMNKVDRDLIDELRARFARMDESCRGVLSKDTLIATAKRRLRSPARKLQLSLYKQQLLQGD